MYRVLFLLFLFAGIGSFAQQQTSSIGFIENKGQIVDQKGKANKAVKYLLNTSGLNVQLRKNGFSYDVYETKKHPLNKRQIEKQRSFGFIKAETLKNPNYTLEYIYHRIDIDFVNCNPNVQLISEGKSTDHDNYYNVPSAPDGILEVHKFQRITYQNIYPNIDVVFFIPEEKSKPVEYNFIVKPGGKIADIQLKFNGAKSELLDNKIKINTRFGAMEETLPMSWTENDNNKKEITISYKKIKNNVYGFDTSENIMGKKVVIDPVPNRLWGTFYGENEYNYFSDIVTDSNGNSYISGFVYNYNSTGLYASSGAFQSVIDNDYTDGIIAKFDSDGKRVWGTYYGGEHFDEIHGIVTDSQGNIIITGITSSNNNISTNNSYQPNLSDLEPGASGWYDDAFLVKFNPSGGRIWGTYFGGKSTDNALDVDVDKNDNIYIVGKTNSKNAIAINSNFQTKLNQEVIPVQYPDPYDGFLSKFNLNGDLIWSTYVGGEKEDIIETIKISSDYLILGGETKSLKYISTPNVHLENHYPEQYNNDATVYKFDLEGKRIWGTYYGSKSFSYAGDIVNSVAIDDENNIYIGGSTDSLNNISTSGCFQKLKYDGDGPVAFLAKLNPNGQRIWGTYFGSHTTLSSLIFKNDYLYIGGTGGWAHKPITTICRYRDENSEEAYWGKLTKNGNLVYGTCVGGSTYYKEQKIDVTSDAVIVAGVTNVNNGIGDINSYQPSIKGKVNFYLIKFSNDTNFNIPTISSNISVCIGSNLNLTATGGTNYYWTGPNGFTSTQQNPTIPNATTSHTGKYSCAITGTGGCDDTITIDVLVGDNAKPIPDTASLPTINRDCHTTITNTPTATDNCAGTINATTTDPLSYTLPGNYVIHWNYNDGNGNTETQTQNVIISNVILPAASSPQTFCIQQNTTINEIQITGQNIKWYDSQTGGNLVTGTPLLQDGVTYYASQTPASCESARVPVTVNIQNTATPAGNNQQTLCASQNPTLNEVIINGSNTKWYSTSSSTTTLPATAILVDGTTYYTSQTINDCESINRMAVSISLITTLNANDYSAVICDDENNGIENVDLSDFNSFLLNTSGNTFTYFSSSDSAENEITADQINTNYGLTLGINSIYVRINSSNGCHQIVHLLLTLISEPIFTIPDEVILCEGKKIPVDAGAGFDSYLWSNNHKKQVISINQPGNYWVTVTKNHGSVTCSATKNFVVSLSNPATITSIETEDWTDNQNKITVNTSGLGNYEYSLDAINYQESNIFTGLASGNYTIYVRDKNNCGTTIKSAIYLLIYPKFFTPNSDGYHDNWFVKFSQFEENFLVQIYDRYAKLIKSMNNTESWDGTYNEKLLPSDDYWFYITRNDGQIYKGHFALKR